VELYNGEMLLSSLAEKYSNSGHISFSVDSELSSGANYHISNRSANPSFL